MNVQLPTEHMEEGGAIPKKEVMQLHPPTLDPSPTPRYHYPPQGRSLGNGALPLLAPLQGAHSV